MVLKKEYNKKYRYNEDSIMAICLEIDTKGQFSCMFNSNLITDKQELTFFTDARTFAELVSDFDIVEVTELTVKQSNGVEFQRKPSEVHIYANFKEAFLNAGRSIGVTSQSEQYGDDAGPYFKISIV